MPGLTAQLLPIYTTGTTLFVNILLATVQAQDTVVSFQFLTPFSHPATYATIIQVSGNVSGSVNAGAVAGVVGI